MASNNIYPNTLSLQEELNNARKHTVDYDAVDNVLKDPGLTADELNSTVYKSDYKKFREKLRKDIDKYHRLETWYGKVITGLTSLTWLLGFISFVLSGVVAIMSSMIYNNTSAINTLSQSQFNSAMLITNWLDIIFLIVAGLIQIFSNRQNGNLTKHTAHKTKAREYINILTTDFNNAYSDKIITTDEMKEMTNLQYEYEQMQISLSGSYYVSGSTSSTSPSTNNTSITMPSSSINAPLLNDTQISFLKILENFGKNQSSVQSTYTPAIV